MTWLPSRSKTLGQEGATGADAGAGLGLGAAAAGGATDVPGPRRHTATKTAGNAFRFFIMHTSPAPLPDWGDRMAASYIRLVNFAATKRNWSGSGPLLFWLY